MLDAQHHKIYHILKRLSFGFPLVCLFLLLSLPHVVQSQESASLFVPAYTTNRSLSVRQNICDRAQLYDNQVSDDLDIRYALQGLKLNVAAIKGIYFLYENNTLNEEYPGLMAALMDEVAKRGRFTWRDSFGVYDGPTGNRTWTEMLLFMTNYYDISVEWWVETLPRLKLGLAFPERWYDASYILVTAKDETSKRKVNMWGWLLPFEADVWILILFTLLWSGVVYMFLEYLAFPSQYTGRRARQSFGNDIFLSFLLFTQHFQFTPKTPASRILATSMAFWALLISSAYTANLASFFVDETKQSQPLTTIEDAIRSGRPICVWDTAASGEYVQETYPAGNYIKLEQEEDLYIYVNKGFCAAAVTSVQSFQDYSRTRATNADCRLHWTGNIIQRRRAGFATKSDAGRQCTSLVHDVINILILDMVADGTMERIWQEHYVRNLDHSCEESEKDDEQESQRRSIQEMGGTFVVHFSVSLLAIVLAVVTKILKVCKKRNLTPVGKSLKQSAKKSESKDVLSPLPNRSMNMNRSMNRSSNLPVTASTLLRDFWAETPSAAIMKDDSIYSQLMRPEDGIGGLNNEKLMELLQDDLHQQLDQAEQRLENKMQQQHNQLEEMLRKQQDLFEQRIQEQELKMQRQNIQLQDKLTCIMDFLKENQQGGLCKGMVVPENGDKGNNRDQSQSSILSVASPTALEGKETQSHLEASKFNESKKARLRLKPHQIPQLLYPHDEQELRGALAQHFGTAGIDIPEEANEISVTLRKVV